MSTYPKAFRRAANSLYINTIIRSTVLFLLSWLLFWLVLNGLLWVIAGLVSPESGTFYPMPGTLEPYSKYFSSTRIQIELLPIAGIVLINLICLVPYPGLRRSSYIHLGMTWFTFHGWNYVFGKTIYNLISSTGLNVVADWLSVSDYGRIFLIELSLSGLFLTGLLISRPYFRHTIRFIYSWYLGKTSFTFFLMLLSPFLIGIGILSLIFYSIQPALLWIFLLYIPSLISVAYRTIWLLQSPHDEEYTFSRKVTIAQMN